MDAQLKISRAVTNLAFNNPFFGSCLMQLKLEEKQEVSTMATNGTHVYWGRDFVDSISEEEVRFVLSHEVMHVILKHCQNFEGKDPQLCNVAMDYVINPQLSEAGFSMVEGALYDETGKFHNMAWEEVYRCLDDIQNDREPPVSMSEGEKNKIKEDIKKSTDHLEPSQAQSEAGKGEESDKIDDMVIRAATAQEMSGKGGLPQGVKERVKAIREHQVAWTEKLELLVKAKYPEDFTFSRPNRRHIGSGLYLPTMDGHKAGPIAIAVDTSGSVSKQELELFVAEINNIINDIRPEKVYLMSADCQVAEVVEYESDHYFEDFDAVGGGGTSFVPVFNHVEKEGLQIDQLIYFSDMYVGDRDFPENHPDYPVIFCSSGSERDVPFGDLIKIKV
jgi:predicted metal-dependent peptidase